MGIPALMPFQVPQQQQFNLADTYVQMARMKAYQQQARLDELTLGQEQRKQAKDLQWESFMRGVFTPEEQGSGLAAAPPPQAMPQPPQGGLATAQAGPPQGGMPPSLAAMAQPTDTSQPPLMNPSMQVAPVQGPPPPPQAPSLAAAQAPAPPAPAPGLGQGSGTRPTFQGLLQPINERALLQAHAANPERTEKWFTGYMKMQGDKIAQVQKVNGQIYQTLKAVEKSPNQPEAWARGIASLREQGIPIPKDLDTFSPALLQFKLNEHRTAETEVKEAEAEHKRQQASAEQALTAQREQETRLKPAAQQAWIAGQQATTDKTRADTAQTRQQIAMAPASQASRLAKEAADTQNALADAAEKKVRTGLLPTKDEREALTARDALKTSEQAREFQATAEKHNALMRPLQEKELDLKNQREKVTLDTALTAEERAAALGKIEQQQKQVDLERSKVAVPEYVKGAPDTNAAIYAEQKRTGKEGQAPDAATMEAARQQVLADKIAPHAAAGREAAAVELRKPIVLDAIQKGQIGEQVSNTLDDIEELAYGGALTSSLKDRWRMIAQTVNGNPDDMEAAREWAIRNLGESMTLAMAGGKLGGNFSNTDAERVAAAAGAFDKAQTPAQRKVALRVIREIAERNMEFGNKHITGNVDMKGIPEFGKVRQERKAKEITREKLDRAIAAKPEWKGREDEAIAWYQQNGYRVRID